MSPAQLNENDAVNQPDGTPTTAPNTVPAPRPNGGPFGGAEVTPTTLPFATGVPFDDGSGSSRIFDSRVLLRATLALAGSALLFGAVPLTRAGLHQRRLHRVAADPIGRAELDWDTAIAALRLVGLAPAPSETPLEFGRRAVESPIRSLIRWRAAPPQRRCDQRAGSKPVELCCGETLWIRETCGRDRPWA